MVPHTDALYKFSSKAEDCVHCGCLLNIFSDCINPISLGLEHFTWFAFTHKPLSLSFACFISSWKSCQRLIKYISIDILDFSFNSVMESCNSSLLVHLPTFVDKMPVTPKSGTSVTLPVLWHWTCIDICIPWANMNQCRTCMSETGWRLCKWPEVLQHCWLKQHLSSLIFIAFG